MNNASTQVFEESVDWHFCPSALSLATLPLSLCWTTMIRHHFVSLWASKLAYSISPWLLAKCLDQRDFIYLSQICIFHCLLSCFISTKGLSSCWLSEAFLNMLHRPNIPGLSAAKKEVLWVLVNFHYLFT